MSGLADFCNRIGIDSEFLRVIKKDNILYHKKTAEPIIDWVIFNAIHNPIQDNLVFHNFGDDENFYIDPSVLDGLHYLPRSMIYQLANESTTFKKLDSNHSITINEQTYLTNLFHKVCEGDTAYKMIYPFDDIGNFSFNVDFKLEVLSLKRTSTSLVNRANLDVLNADDYSYSARLNLYHGGNQKMHFSPHYITDFSDPINRKLMLINHVLYDLWQDLQQVKGFLKSSILPVPTVLDKQKGHYFTLVDTDNGVDVSLDTFFQFRINRDESIKLARKFITRYKEYNDPLALQVMKMLNLINPTSLSSMLDQDIHSFYNDIDAFENYITVFEMTTI